MTSHPMADTDMIPGRTKSKMVMGLGVAIALLGVTVAVVPEQTKTIVDWTSREGLYIAAGMRVVSGLILFLAAPGTRYPKGMRIFGGVVLAAGLALPLLPIELWARLIRWWLVDNALHYRVGGGVFGLLIGAFLIHAARPAR